MRMVLVLLLMVCLLPASGMVWAFDINQADLTQLQGLKGIGPRLAERVLAERAKGAFRDFDDLSARVKGIGPARIRQWRDAGVVVSPPAHPLMTTTPKAGGSVSRPSSRLGSHRGATIEIIEGRARRRKP